ncbi:MAG: DUF1566 domain-containing protein [Treponema sp.]|nr:DUF1566 domain-containing protein [Treponema sp.]
MLEGGVPGLAGGYVFYDKGAYSDGWRYMECAPDNVGENVSWTIAKTLCDEYALNGYDDWDLPSIKELTLMYKNLHEKGMGNFVSTGSNVDRHWSSEETKDGQAYYFRFNSETTSSAYKSDSHNARPVRKF